MERALSERLTIISLIDAYGGLLTARQLVLLRLYYLDDLSLGEIGERLEITRQAVSDSLRRSVGELTRLEDSLHILSAADQKTKQKEQIKVSLDALARSVAGLAGTVDEKTLDGIADQIAALRRACRFPALTPSLSQRGRGQDSGSR